MVIWPLLLSGIFLLPGCSSIRNAHSYRKAATDAFFRGELRIADRFDRYAEKRAGTGDELMWFLEAGAAEFARGDYRRSRVRFDQAGDSIREYDRRAVVSAREVSAEAAALVTNPNLLPYRGWIVDRIMLHAFQGLNYLALGNTPGFQVELRRLRDRQREAGREFAREIEEERKLAAAFNRTHTRNFPPPQPTTDSPNAAEVKAGLDTALRRLREADDPAGSGDTVAREKFGSFYNPFAIYLSAIGYYLEKNWGEARLDLERLREILPRNPQIAADFAAVSRQLGESVAASADQLAQQADATALPGSGDLYLFVAAGRAPALEERKLQLVLPYTGYIGIAWGELRDYPVPAPVQAEFGQRKLTLTPLADFNAIVRQEYRQRLPGFLLRSIVAAVARAAAGTTLNILAAQQSNDAIKIGAFLGGSFYNWLFNTADTRRWELLPQRIDFTRLRAPDGGTLTIRAAAGELALPVEKTGDGCVVFLWILDGKPQVSGIFYCK